MLDTIAFKDKIECAKLVMKGSHVAKVLISDTMHTHSNMAMTISL